MNDLIQWPRAKYWDKPWNSVLGCRGVSPACDNCYARAYAKRFGMSFEPHPQARKVPKKGVVFCGNMTDIAGEWRQIDEVAADIAACVSRKATYIWLTKRVKRMIDAMNYIGDRMQAPEKWFENHYFGFTAENQEWYEKRLEPFLDSFPKWAKAWVSAEPLLGHLGFMFQNTAIREKIRWVVVGCESGRNRRKCPIEFVEDVVDQCRRFNVPVFVKQLDLNGKCETDINKFPEHLRIRQVPWATKEDTK